MQDKSYELAAAAAFFALPRGHDLADVMRPPDSGALDRRPFDTRIAELEHARNLIDQAIAVEAISDSAMETRELVTFRVSGPKHDDELLVPRIAGLLKQYVDRVFAGGNEMAPFENSGLTMKVTTPWSTQ